MPHPNQGVNVRNVWVVVWGRATKDDDYGQPAVNSAPEEILVQWRDTPREVATPTAQQVAIDATITIDRDIEVGSVVWVGRLDDLVGTDQDLPPGETVRRVVTAPKEWDVKGRACRRTATLSKLRDDLPTRV